MEPQTNAAQRTMLSASAAEFVPRTIRNPPAPNGSTAAADRNQPQGGQATASASAATPAHNPRPQNDKPVADSSASANTNNNNSRRRGGGRGEAAKHADPSAEGSTTEEREKRQHPSREGNRGGRGGVPQGEEGGEREKEKAGRQRQHRSRADDIAHPHPDGDQPPSAASATAHAHQSQRREGGRQRNNGRNAAANEGGGEGDGEGRAPAPARDQRGGGGQRRRGGEQDASGTDDPHSKNGGRGRRGDDGGGREARAGGGRSERGRDKGSRGTDASNRSSASARNNATGNKDGEAEDSEERLSAVTADRTPFLSVEQAALVVRDVSDTTTAATRQICTELLTGEYECVLCLVAIRAQVATWSCSSCYHVFHLSCVKHWAKQPESGSGKTFRCPHCQAPDNTAAAYYCYCGKQRDPKYDPNIVPHSCGEGCGKRRAHHCPHPCPAMCHPGPCPPCPRTHTARCPCGASTYDYGCDKADPKLTCGAVCGKKLACGNHTCTRPCHNGPCGKCDKTQDIPCVCGKQVKALPCGAPAFSCEAPCGKLQRCGHHACPVTCHTGNCPPCDYDVASVTTCPCGKEPLGPDLRKLCTDPIPTCGAVCGKPLLCGNHTCEEPCHDGPCKQCTIKVLAKCRCGQVQAKVVCSERDQFRCEKKCKGPLKCTKHECPELCCAYRGKVHPNGGECPRICNKQLICGHSCTERCHPNMCPACPNVITSILQCRCGNQQLIPPLPCGTQPPRCYLPCTLPRPCGHGQTKHDCHYGDCPPCMHPVKKRCNGGHRDVEVFCGSGDHVSCGAKCGRPLPCGHSCDRLCHDGPCADEGEVCMRPCGKVLDDCGHFCAIPCHSSKPKVVCKCTSKVTVPCECGRRSEEVGCAKYQKLLNKRLEEKEAAVAKIEAAAKVALAAAKVSEAGEGEGEGSEEESSKATAVASAAAPQSSSAVDASLIEDLDRPLTVPCDDDCAYHNRLAALAARTAPKIKAQHKATIYSLRLWEAAGSSLDVVGKIETKLNEFIRSPALELMMPAMPKDKRIIVHELANFYHLHCESVDREPNRSCFLTKTMQSTIPTPQLTAARINKALHAATDPVSVIVSVITNPSLACAQTLIFRGDKNLNEIAINGYLKEIIGSFVAVQSEEAYGMCSHHATLVGSLSKKMHGPLFDVMEEFTYFAVFATKFDTDAGFALLRKNGCPVLYQRVGEAPPPAKHSWEPRRDPATGEVIEGEEAAYATPVPKAPKSWGEMFAKPHLNAKQRREIENSKVELTGGAFAKLSSKK